MISFVCPYCAKAFTVADSLAGASVCCSQCGADVAVPAAPAPIMAAPPPPPRSSAGRFATISLVLGLITLFTCCLTSIPGIIFGALALSKPGVDPPARKRALAGVLLSIFLPILSLLGLWIWGQRIQRDEDRDLATADAAYAQKRWEEARPLYEKHRDSTRDEIRAMCHARLGRIAFALGDVAGAKREFEFALDAKHDYAFSCEDPEVLKLWRECVERHVPRRSHGSDWD